MTDFKSEENTSFLSMVSDYIIDKHIENLDKICIVFPNRRAGLFLKNILANKLQKNFWAPTVFSIEDFICELSDKKITENIKLLIELYFVHQEIEKENIKSFDEFIGWGQMLLSDFNEVDLHLVNADDLFSYLSESKAISLWNTNGKPLTDYQRKYLHLYKSLSSYYKDFTNQLAAKNFTYQGMVYRFVAENIDKIDTTKKWKKIIFAGFNTLTVSEEKIIKKLIQLDKAEILWDTDKYYIEDELQEAGNHIRKIKNKIDVKNFNWVFDNFKNSNKKIKIIGAVNGISQVKIAGNILKEMIPAVIKNTQIPFKTAVVLIDENLLLPLLYSLPSEINQLNITMGFPLKNAPIYSLFDNLFTMHENSKRLSKAEFSNKQTFYFKDLIKLFSHHYIINLLNANEEHIIETIIAQNKVFWETEEILALIAENKLEIKLNLRELLNNWNVHPYRSLKSIENFLTLLQKNIVNKTIEKDENNFNSDIELAYLYSFSKIINNLEFTLKSIAELVDLKTLHSLFSQIVNLTKLPFNGEPLKGLQIMGLLETRTLDFENLIVISVNEGLIPTGKTNNSLIPVEIKRQYKMATYKEHDSIFAYHFYRLLQRAKNIYLIYNTQTDEFGKGEKSRFLNQIIEELPKYNKNTLIDEYILSSIPEKELTNYSITIKKEEFILTELKKIAVMGFSPTAINTYRTCKLKFYFQYILKYEEIKTLNENIDAVTLGNIIHETLHLLYKPYINRIIECSHIEIMLKEKEIAILKACEILKLNSDNIRTGKNHLIYKVAIKLINNFLSQEMKDIASLKKDSNFITLLALENEIKKSININLNEKDEFTINLKGRADRIDSIENNIRIIDYKTGNLEKNELLIKDWEDLINNPQMDKSFQLLYYAFLAKAVYHKPIQSGIISFRKLKEGFQNVKMSEKKQNLDEIDLTNFETILKQILTEMFDKNVPFYQTEAIERCTFCPFAMICQRI